MLGGHSERILRDVTAAHRALAAELRVAAEQRERRRLAAARGIELTRGGDGGEPVRERPRHARLAARPRRLDGLEPPAWIDE